MWRLIALGAVFWSQVATIDLQHCMDMDPFCSQEDCRLRPGYAIFHCRDTCNHCKTPTCTDSLIFPCKVYFTFQCELLKNLADYCPVLCGICDAYGRVITPPILLGNTTQSVPQTTTVTPSTSTTTTATVKTSTKAPTTTKILMETSTNLHTTPAANIIPFAARIVPAELKPSIMNLTNAVCVDTMPGCSVDGCTIMPGVYLTGCRLTCNNCNDEKCHDSDQFPCINAPVTNCKTDRILKQYCPKKCGLCNIRPKTTPKPILPIKPQLLGITKPIDENQNTTCVDIRPDICMGINIQEACSAKPGYYMTLCQSTCNNCDGTICMDSVKINCTKLMVEGFCEFSAVMDYCPYSCGQCLSSRRGPLLIPAPPGFHPFNGGLSSDHDCFDRLPNCKQLSRLGWCLSGAKKDNMKMYCKESCGYCLSYTPQTHNSIRG